MMAMILTLALLGGVLSVPVRYRYQPPEESVDWWYDVETMPWADRGAQLENSPFYNTFRQMDQQLDMYGYAQHTGKIYRGKYSHPENVLPAHRAFGEHSDFNHQDLGSGAFRHGPRGEPKTPKPETPTTTTTTPAPYYDNVVLRLIARNSQNNNAVVGATGSVNIQGDVVVDEVAFDASGELFVPVTANGIYSVQVQADGFITSDFEVEVACTEDNCQIDRLVLMSPVLPPGQTRIMISWETANPRDVDTHVMAVRNSDRQTCKTYYRNRNGCDSVSQDLDNTRGGLNGAETVTLLDSAINSNYRYLVGIHDYNFEDDGVPFLNSGSSMTVTNGIQTINERMEGSGPITSTNGFYFFGCIDVQANGESYAFTSAPAGTFFNGQETNQWLAMMDEHC